MFLLDITGQALSKKLQFSFTQSTKYFLKISWGNNQGEERAFVFLLVIFRTLPWMAGLPRDHL